MTPTRRQDSMLRFATLPLAACLFFGAVKAQADEAQVPLYKLTVGRYHSGTSGKAA